MISKYLLLSSAKKVPVNNVCTQLLTVVNRCLNFSQYPYFRYISVHLIYHFPTFSLHHTLGQYIISNAPNLVILWIDFKSINLSRITTGDKKDNMHDIANCCKPRNGSVSFIQQTTMTSQRLHNTTPDIMLFNLCDDVVYIITSPSHHHSITTVSYHGSHFTHLRLKQSGGWVDFYTDRK